MTKPATPPPRPLGDGQVVDEMLDPGVVGVAVGRLAELPADVVFGAVGPTNRRR